MDLWDIFYTKTDFETFLKSKGLILKKNIKVLNKLSLFYADPFILNIKKNLIEVLVEDFSYLTGGKLSSLKINIKSRKVSKKILIKGKHFSYPHIVFENKFLYLFPEMAEEDENIIFKNNNNKLYPVKNYLFGENVVDPSIIKFNKLYWLFCSFKNRQENKDLYLFYSKTLLGNWTGHPLNPIIKNKSNARSAGNIVLHKGSLYIPSQESRKDQYGEKLVINKIIKLDKKGYKDKIIFKVNAINENYNGIHHISYKNNYFVFDQKYNKYSILKLFYYVSKKFIFKKYIKDEKYQKNGL